MPRNVLLKAMSSDRTLAQRIKGVVREVEKRNKDIALTAVMDKLI